MSKRYFEFGAENLARLQFSSSQKPYDPHMGHVAANDMFGPSDKDAVDQHTKFAKRHGVSAKLLGSSTTGTANFKYTGPFSKLHKFLVNEYDNPSGITQHGPTLRRKYDALHKKNANGATKHPRATQYDHYEEGDGAGWEEHEMPKWPEDE